MEYADFFSRATKHRAPYPYQQVLVDEPWPELLNVQTGLGKTAAVTLAWAWRRGWRADGTRADADPATPRRLIWCLPMRVLVEQTAANLNGWLEALGLNRNPNAPRVHVLMGGASDLQSWAEAPEQDAILIGTQDMLLSRALMRGYGMSRYQWPIHFALVHNDALWALDEVQLMGAGLTTSAQLEAFRRSFPLSAPSRTLWLSATLAPEWLSTVDLRPHLPSFEVRTISDADRAAAGERIAARKSVGAATVRLTAETNKQALQNYARTLGELAIDRHSPDHQTLVIVNTVDKAQDIFQHIRAKRPDRDDLLIHARFRPTERSRIQEQLAEPGADRIIVATQAIEAGVDISSRVLITELAPWASMVQRFGRCNRYGEHNASGGGQILWVDADPAAEVQPYEQSELSTARMHLQTLKEAGPEHLPPTSESAPLHHVLRRKDLLELFNTDPDLSGFDVDISDYIRDQDQPSVQLFWRAFDGDPNAPAQLREGRDELCPASINQTRELLKRAPGWNWDPLDGRWSPVPKGASPRPGSVLLLRSTDGGYDPSIGFRHDLKAWVEPAESPTPIDTDDQYASDWRCQVRHPVKLTDHLAHVANAARQLCDSVGEQRHAALIERAGRWHDVGKAHPVFDRSMHRCPEAPAGLLAKSNCATPLRHERKHFRHELASALAFLENNDDPAAPALEIDVIAYLIAAHHGKVRLSMRAMPGENDPDGAPLARGVRQGDRLPALSFDGEHLPETVLRLNLMELGTTDVGRSWAERTANLLAHFGPFTLAWLETLVRLADWRASALEQHDAFQDNPSSNAGATRPSVEDQS